MKKFAWTNNWPVFSECLQMLAAIYKTTDFIKSLNKWAWWPCFQGSLYPVSAAICMTLRHWMPKSQIFVFRWSVKTSNSSPSKFTLFAHRNWIFWVLHCFALIWIIIFDSCMDEASRLYSFFQTHKAYNEIYGSGKTELCVINSMFILYDLHIHSVEWNLCLVLTSEVVFFNYIQISVFHLRFL